MSDSSRSRNIFINASSLIAASLIAKVAAVPVTALMLRTVEKDVFGQYSYLISFVSIFGVLATLGLPSYMQREIVQQPNKAPVLMKASYVIEIFFSLLTVGLILLTGSSGHNAPPGWLLLISAIGVVAGATSTLFLYTINGLNRSYISAAIQLIISAFNLVGMLAVLFIRPQLDALIWVFSISGVAQHILALIAFRHFFPEISLASWPKWKDYKSVFVESLPYIFLLAFSTIYYRIDIVLLGIWGTLSEVASYSAAYKFIDIISMLCGIIGSVFFAEFSKMFADKDPSMGNFMKRGFRYMLLIALPLAAWLCAYSGDILLLFYGNKYLQSTTMLQVLAWTTVFLFARNLQTGMIQSCNYVRIQVIVFATSSLLNIGLNYLLIPTQGGLGASLSTLICEIFNFIAFSYFIYKKFRISLVEQWLIPTAFAFISMELALYVGVSLPIALSFIISLSVYLGVLYLAGGLFPEDFLLWKRTTAQFIRRTFPS
jgi:O-antigen/teichoic acid export membrane protein